MSLSLIVVACVLVGMMLAGVGAVVGWRRPSSRRLAFTLVAVAVVLQAWWVVAAVVVFFKFTVLGQDT
jgi:hypothetical protein